MPVWVEALRADNAALKAAAEDFHGLRIDFSEVGLALRAALLVVPIARGTEVLTAMFGGVRWIIGFSSLDELNSYAAARLDASGWEFATVRGERVLGPLRAAIPGPPVGVAVDVAGTAPVLVPPKVAA